MFLRLAAVFDKIDGIQIAGIEAVALQDGRGEVGLQSSIAEATARIALEVNCTSRLQSPQTPS